MATLNVYSIGNSKMAAKSKPYTVPNPGPIPRLELEEGLPAGGLDHLAWVDEDRKRHSSWCSGLPWHERLHARATMSSLRRNVALKHPFAPKNDLDFVLEAIYDPYINTFADKQDPYLHKETVFGEDLNLMLEAQSKIQSNPKGISKLTEPKWKEPKLPACPTWRVLRNRVVVYPDSQVPRDHPMTRAPPPYRRENVYNVKLGIAADHSPQTNPGYSRTPSGSFYSI